MRPTNTPPPSLAAASPLSPLYVRWRLPPRGEGLPRCVVARDELTPATTEEACCAPPS